MRISEYLVLYIATMSGELIPSYVSREREWIRLYCTSCFTLRIHEMIETFPEMGSYQLSADGFSAEAAMFSFS